MDKNPLLVENENKRLVLPLPMLACHAMFAVWQMGVMLFSGEALSIGGRTPFPIDIDNQTALIAAAYILSVVFLIFFQRFCVTAARAGIGIALISALGLYIPFPPETLAAFYYVQAFCCSFLVGVSIAIEASLYKEKTALKFRVVALILSGCLIAALQNQVAYVSFGVFQIFTAAALALLLFFFCKLPSKVWPRYVKKSGGMVKPLAFMAGLFLLVGLSSIMALFGSVVAESITHGVSVYYVSLAVCGLVLAVLWKRGIVPLKSTTVLVAVGALGFIVAIVSLYFPAFSLPACALLGAGLAVCYLSNYFGLVMLKRYPSRFIMPIMMTVALIAIIIHSGVLETFRDNPQVLYIIFLVVSVAMAILYLMLEPYLLYSFRGRTLQDIIGEVADDTDEEKNRYAGTPRRGRKHRPIKAAPVANCRENGTGLGKICRGKTCRAERRTAP